MKTLYFAADHAGFELKQSLLAYNEAFLRFKALDLGTYSLESVDYPDYALKTIQKLKEDSEGLGVLICGTGIGMSIMANRFPWIRAALCNDSIEAAELARAHNNANVLCLGGRLVDPEEAPEILKAFTQTPFDGGRHQRRLKKIDTFFQQKKC